MLKNKYRILYLIVAIAVLFMIAKTHINNKKNNNNNINFYKVKVGIYEYEPCYYIDKNNNIKGYYYDVLNTINKYDNFQYEYHLYSFEEVMNKLESGEIDLVVGINKTEDRENKFEFSARPIGVEKYGLFSNDKTISFSDLEAMSNSTLGIVKSGYNGSFITKIFSDNKVDVKVVEFEEQSELLDDFNENKIDLSIQPIGQKTHGKAVYEFSSGPVYIGVNKNNKYIINHIDEVMNQNLRSIEKQLDKSYRKYFHYKDPNSNQLEGIISKTLYILSFIAMILLIKNRKKIKSFYIQMKIRKRILKDKYMAYYQPIYNPNDESIVGFEALIRQKSKNGKVLSPDKFIKEIEKNNMMSEVSLMILKKVISDYKNIHEKYKLKNKKYISINISATEIVNDKFVEKCCNIIKSNNIPEAKICLEIIERVKAENIEYLNESIEKLKNAGFLIAIDDFGIEYSNLDLLDKIDFDIIKLDRYFIYAISKDYVKEEILKFLSSLSKRSHSVIVIEGVETEEQVDLIKQIDNDKIYVQGYYYSKPVAI